MTNMSLIIMLIILIKSQGILSVENISPYPVAIGTLGHSLTVTCSTTKLWKTVAYYIGGDKFNAVAFYHKPRQCQNIAWKVSKYTFRCNSTTFEFAITVPKLTLKDHNNIISCRVENDDTKNNYNATSVIFVQVPVRSITLYTITGKTNNTERETFTLECCSAGSRPAAIITWHTYPLGIKLWSLKMETFATTDADGLIKAQSRMHYNNITTDMHYVIYCIAKNTISEVQSNNVTIYAAVKSIQRKPEPSKDIVRNVIIGITCGVSLGIILSIILKIMLSKQKPSSAGHARSNNSNAMDPEEMQQREAVLLQTQVENEYVLDDEEDNLHRKRKTTARTKKT